MPVCDICMKTIPEGSAVISNKRMKDAIVHGFNPFKTGLNTQAVEMGAAMGMSEEQVYSNWTINAMRDTTDWMLCPTCTRGFENATR